MNKKLLISIICIVVVVATTLILFLTFKNEKTIVLECSKERQETTEIKLKRSFNISKTGKNAIIVEINSFDFTDKFYNQLLLKGYKPEHVLQIYSISIQNEITEKLASYSDYVTVETNTLSNALEVKTTYSINKKNKDEMKEFMNYDFYNNDIEEIEKYYIKGGFKCEVK